MNACLTGRHGISVDAVSDRPMYLGIYTTGEVKEKGIRLFFSEGTVGPLPFLGPNVFPRVYIGDQSLAEIAEEFL